MKKIIIVLAFGLLVCQLSACKGVKSISGSLKKSEPTRLNDQATPADYAAAPTTTSASGSASVTVAAQPASTAEIVKQPDSAATTNEYKKDYGRVAGVSPGNTQAGTISVNPDVRDGLLKQYAEMDRLADLVVYELSIVERKWDILLGKFKTASPAERDRISTDLDRLNDDQLKLYRAHVKIYKEGKSDWDRTKKEVETTLLSVRGISEK